MKKDILLTILLLFNVAFMFSNLYLDVSETTRVILNILIFMTYIFLTVQYIQNLRDSWNERKENLTKKELP